jgi:hypothetical protein
VEFIAMEYVAGKTLDKLIGRKGLRLNEALRYAVQIADGWRPRTMPGSFIAISNPRTLSSANKAT